MITADEATTRPDDNITLRFLTAPTDVTGTSGSVSAGRVLEWIDKAGYACAVGWSKQYCVTAYVGDVHFSAPINVGQLVEVHARIIHTGRTTMHVLVTVDSSDVRDRRTASATHCILIFVALGEDRRPTRVPEWSPRSELDHTLNERAQSRIEPRKRIQQELQTQHYGDEGTAPRTVFRFLASPSDVNWGGKVHGGIVMRWIDETAFACAASWSSTDTVCVYSGGIHFYRPIRIGDIVEVEARIIHTTARSMHLSIQVRSADPLRPQELELTTRCSSIYVDLDADRNTLPVRALSLVTEEDRLLDLHGRTLIRMREEMRSMPIGGLDRK